MAILSQGPYGAYEGKLGNTIAFTWKGIQCLRIKPASVANPNTEAQQDQRKKFLLTLKFLQPLREAVNLGFRDYAVKMSAFNSAFSYNIKNAIAGTFPDYSIDYASVLLSRGMLKGALNPAAGSTQPGIVSLSWADNSSEPNAAANDQAMVYIYNPTTNEAVVSHYGPARMEEAQAVTVPDSFSGSSVHTWIAFVSADRKLISDSKYAGAVTVA